MIGGFFVYRIASMDKGKLTETIDYAKNEAARMQEEKTTQPDKKIK